MASMFSRRPTVTEVIVVVGVVLIAYFILNPTGDPYYNKAKANRALQHAKLIGAEAMFYADDHGGAFPFDDSGVDANRCLAPLVPYLGSEKPFYLHGSAWHAGPFEDGPDDCYEESELPGIALEPGENGWAFNRAASRDGREDMPMLTPAFTEQIGTYSDDEDELGGWLRGRYGVVIYADGSGAMPLMGDGLQLRDETGKNLFLAPDCDFVNPALPRD